MDMPFCWFCHEAAHFQALNYLPNLEELNASGNRIRSVSDLSKCKQLQEVDLSRNRITDLSGLKGLPRLLVSYVPSLKGRLNSVFGADLGGGV